MNSNTISCKRLATIVSHRKYIARPFFRRKLVSMSKPCHCIWFCTLLLYFGICVYLFLPDKGLCYVFFTRNNFCKFLASYGVIIQSVIQSYLKTSICGASLSYSSKCHWKKNVFCDKLKNVNLIQSSSWYQNPKFIKQIRPIYLFFFYLLLPSVKKFLLVFCIKNSMFHYRIHVTCNFFPAFFPPNLILISKISSVMYFQDSKDIETLGPSLSTNFKIVPSNI